MSAKEWNRSLDPRAGPRALGPLLPLQNAGSTAAILNAARARLRAPVDAADQADGGRRKIWQLASTLHCSIIGTCLTTGELHALLRKFKVLVTTDPPTDHDLHGLAVATAGTRSPLAKQIQKALDRRHGAAIHRFAKARSPEELGRLWDEAKRNGDIPGGYWSVMTHPLASDDLVRHAFGDVHMLSHLVGAANRADIRRLHQLEREKAALEDKLARQQAHLRDSIVARDTKIRDLNQMLAARIEQSSAPSITDSSTEFATLTELVVNLTKRLEVESERRQRAERRGNELASARADAERGQLAADRELTALRSELEAAEAALAAFSDEGEPDANALDLAGITLLYVGGRSHLIAHLKAMIERASGQFFHHDGGIEENKDLLPGLVSRADAAFFPVDCISHSAAQSLKRFCRQSGKPFVPLRSSGAASLLQALRSLNLSRARMDSDESVMR